MLSLIAVFLFFLVWSPLILITDVFTGSPVRPGRSLRSCYYFSAALGHVRVIPGTVTPLSPSGESCKFH